jgi:ABC-type transport system involved in multi-copper enzyme maturation permease subunit
MSSSVVARYILKDLYFSWPLMAGAIAVAVLAVPLTALGSIGLFSAMILVVVAGAAPSSFICMYLIAMERKEKSHIFALSLPISGAQVQLAKVLAATTAYVVPWVVMAAGTIALFTVLHVPKGSLPFGIMLWVFLLDQFCLMLAVTAAVGSEALSTVVIVICNVSISFYFFIFLNAPALGKSLASPVAVWSPFVLKVIVIELAVAVLLIAVMSWRLSHTKDFI